MTVMRSTNWKFIGECWGNLVFENTKYPDERILVKCCKYIDMKTRKVYWLKAKPVSEHTSDIPYQKKHFSECQA